MKERKHPDCNSCANQSTKEYEAGTGHCLESKSGYLVDSVQGISLRQFVSEVGCASYKPKNGRNEPLLPLYMQNADEAYDKILSIVVALPKKERNNLVAMLNMAGVCDDSCRRKHCSMKTPCCEEES